MSSRHFGPGPAGACTGGAAQQVGSSSFVEPRNNLGYGVIRHDRYHYVPCTGIVFLVRTWLSGFAVLRPLENV